MLLDTNKYFKLDFTHDQLVALLDKLKSNHVLTPDEYDKLHTLFRDIEIFNYDYNNLINKPEIPDHIDKMPGYNDLLAKINEASDLILTKNDEMNARIDTIQLANDTYIDTEELDANNQERDLARDTAIAALDHKIQQLLMNYSLNSEIDKKSDIEHLHKVDEIIGLETRLAELLLNVDYDGRYACIKHIHEDYIKKNGIVENITKEQLNKLQKFDDLIDDINNEINDIEDSYNHVVTMIIDSQKDIGIIEEATIEQGIAIGNLQNSIKDINIITGYLGMKDEDGTLLEDWPMGNTTAEVGGIQENTDLSGLSIKGILKRMLYPDKKPEVYLNIITEPAKDVYEIGESVKINISITVTKTSHPISSIQLFENGSPKETNLKNISEGGTFENIIDEKTITNTLKEGYYKIIVTDSEGMYIEVFSQAINFYLPYYYGVVEENITKDNITVDMVKSMTKKVDAAESKTCIYNTNNQRMVFAYPASQGPLTSILDGNGFENIRAFNSTVVNIDNKEYYVYLNEPNTNSNFKMTYKYN